MKVDDKIQARLGELAEIERRLFANAALLHPTMGPELVQSAIDLAVMRAELLLLTVSLKAPT